MRSALTLLFLAAVSPAVAAQAQSLAPDMLVRSSTELAPGLYSFGSFSARSIFVVSDAGVVVTDPVNPTHARALRDAVAAVTDKPVRFVVYSHQHWDHVLGGQIFKDEGAQFISHENCLPHWQRHPHPDLVLPDRTVAGTTTLELGDQQLKLLYFGPNHGDCTLVMQLAGSDVLYVNDLVTPYSVGLGFMPDYDPIEWVRTLREIEARDDWSRMVGAHGIPVAPREALVQRRRYMEALIAAVQASIDEGKRMDQLYGALELPEEFQQMRGYQAQLPRAAERIYHALTMGW
jgi:glyoxylase-like metal-dependent hydrolase (beta-lactamase superfamily II)